MSASNWHNSWEDSPVESNVSNRYQIDNVGLQNGLGLPVQLLHPPLESVQSRDFQNQGRAIPLCPTFKPKPNPYPQAVELEKTVDGIPIRCVYVKNIHLEVGYQELCNIFMRHGQILNIHLRYSKHSTNRPMRFAFVTFYNPADASRVLKIRKLYDSSGRYFIVTAADSWHQPKETADGQIIPPGQRSRDVQKENEDLSEQTVSPLKKVQFVQEEGLNSLNDDCLMHLFSYLSWKEIACVERVCKRWQGISYRMWRSLRELNVTKPPFDKLLYSTPVLEHCLKRCGESLSTLELNASTNAYNKATLAIIASYCTNLETLHLANLCIGYRTLAHLGRQSSHLKKLVLDRCTQFKDPDLLSLLPRCPNLSQLELRNCDHITGLCLSKVTGSITSLVLSNCSDLHIPSLTDGLKQMSESLQELTLNYCKHKAVNPRDVALMIAAVPNLTSLSLCNMVSFDMVNLLIGPGNGGLSAIGSLSHLTHLNLTYNFLVNDQVIASFVEGCPQLCSLNLSSSEGGVLKNLTEDGLSLIGRLPKLTSLDISYLVVVTNKALKNITTRNSKLKSLLCRGCPQISDEGSSQVVTVSNDLEVFDLSGCDIGTETVSAAETSVKMRTNNVPLKLIVGGTRVTSDKCIGEEEVPQLTIDLTDLSNDDWRLDFMDNLFFPYSDDDDWDDDFDDDVDDFDHDIVHQLMEGIDYDCGCNVNGCDDLCDPTLCGYHDDTLFRFVGGFDENSEEYENPSEEDYDGNDAEEVYQAEKEDSKVEEN